MTASTAIRNPGVCQVKFENTLVRHTVSDYYFQGMDHKLTEFVDHAREKGFDLATIRQLLHASGWRDKDIAEAFSSRELDIPVPIPVYASAARTLGTRRGESPWPRRAREAFLHLLTFGALFTWVTALILLLITSIDFTLPDPAWRVSQARLDEILSNMRGQIATLIVAFPFFLFLWNYLLREVRRDAQTGRGAIRRWLAYLTLFVGTITLAGDVMTLIYLMLEGQMTIGFLLKAGVLFAVTGCIVLYLSLTLRSESEVRR